MLNLVLIICYLNIVIMQNAVLVHIYITDIIKLRDSVLLA